MRYLFAVALGALLGLPAVAQNLDVAQDAYRRGDYAAALREVRPLAQQGVAEAQTVLGVMYQLGDGVPTDPVEAIKWYRLAAEQDDAEAQNVLGIMYEQGYGVPRDIVQAYFWYSLAAAQGNSLATDNLNSLAINLRPVEFRQAQNLAREWAEKRCK